MKKSLKSRSASHFFLVLQVLMLLCGLFALISDYHDLRAISLNRDICIFRDD